MAPIHNRMPVILRQDDEMRWLSRDKLPADEVQRILAPFPADAMEAYPVSERVNKTDADDEGVIEPVMGVMMGISHQRGYPPQKRDGGVLLVLSPHLTFSANIYMVNK